MHPPLHGTREVYLDVPVGTQGKVQMSEVAQDSSMCLCITSVVRQERKVYLKYIILCKVVTRL